MIFGLRQPLGVQLVATMHILGSVNSTVLKQVHISGLKQDSLAHLSKILNVVTYEVCVCGARSVVCN